MKPINRTGMIVLAILASAAFQATSRAAGPASLASADATVLKTLAGTAIPPAQLGQLRGEGGVSLSLNEARVAGNSVGPNSVTGNNTIAANAVSNNSGITTVFQNTGNNSLFQNSTSIYISVQ